MPHAFVARKDTRLIESIDLGRQGCCTEIENGLHTLCEQRSSSKERRVGVLGFSEQEQSEKACTHITDINTEKIGVSVVSTEVSIK